MLELLLYRDLNKNSELSAKIIRLTITKSIISLKKKKNKTSLQNEDYTTCFYGLSDERHFETNEHINLS